MPVEQPSSSSAVLQTLAWTRKHGFRAVALAFQSKAAISRKYVEPGYETPPDSTWHNSNLGIGVVTGPSSSGPVDIDLDCDEAVTLATKFLPVTPAVFGRASKRASHYLYKVTVPHLAKVALLDPLLNSTIVELRADGGFQTVLPGSLHSDTGELVEWQSAPFPDVPSVDDAALLKAVKRIAIATLVSRHLWFEGQRNEVVKHLSGVFFYLDWTVEDAVELVEAVCDLTGDDDRTRKSTVLLTYKKAERGGKVTGANSLRKLVKEPVLIDRLLDWSGSATVNLLSEYNSRFCVVSVEGKFRIADTDVEPSEPPVFMQKDDFLNLQRPDTVMIDDKPVQKAQLWLANARRRSYRSVDFMPGVEDSPIFNLWTGWAIQASSAGSCEAWLELLSKVICGQDEALTTWFLHWFANIVREPRSKPLTAPVLIGKQGAGKSLLLAYFGRILGSAYTTVTQEEHIYGKFNRHLATTLLLHSEEALYGGEKRHRGVIKSLITDEFRIFEQKGVDARQVRNYLRLALTSNEAHAAPAEPNDRRYTVIDLGDRIVSRELANRVVAEMNNGGPAALFALLQAMQYDPAIARTNVKNEALAVLKGINMSPLESWWYDTLCSGSILPDFAAWASKPVSDWPAIVGSSSLYLSMVIRLRTVGVRQVPSEALFANQLNKFVGLQLERRQVIFANPLSDDAPREIRYLSDRQSSIVNLPSLTDCRKAFTIYVGHNVHWPADVPDSERPAHERY